jgi:sulfur-oxidizing protein SoxX
MKVLITTSVVALNFAFVLALFSSASFADSSDMLPPPEPYCQWQVTNYAIEKPLCGYIGDAKRGKAIASDGSRGNCLACHQLPIDGIEAYGTIGPPLQGVGSRLTEGFIRLRVVDTRHISPMSIMPGFYRDPSLINRPGKSYIGRTFLTAQQVEDVIAYLVTLK